MDLYDIDIYNHLKEELYKYENLPEPKTYEEYDERKFKIYCIKKNMEVINAIRTVINKRINSGATKDDIEKYKKHLTNDTWRNNDLVKEFINSL